MIATSSTTGENQEEIYLLPLTMTEVKILITCIDTIIRAIEETKVEAAKAAFGILLDPLKSLSKRLREVENATKK